MKYVLPVETVIVYVNDFILSDHFGQKDDTMELTMTSIYHFNLKYIKISSMRFNPLYTSDSLM